MAQINISKWDIAEALGLSFEGTTEYNKDYEYEYIFTYMGDNFCNIEENGYLTESEAKEQAAEKLFLELKEAIKNRRS